MRFEDLEGLAVGSPKRREVAVLITTTRRAMAGYVDLRCFDAAASVMWHVRALRNCREWATTGGTGELANKGPGAGATFDDPADAFIVTDVKMVRPLTEQAEKRWYV